MKDKQQASYFLSDDEETLLSGVVATAQEICCSLDSHSKKREHLFPHSIFKSLSELGLMGLSIEEEFGGTAASTSLQAAIYEELSYHNLGPAIFTSVHNMVCRLISCFASDTVKKKYLPKLAKGELLAAFALSEPSAGSDAVSYTHLTLPTKA